MNKLAEYWPHATIALISAYLVLFPQGGTRADKFLSQEFYQSQVFQNKVQSLFNDKTPKLEQHDKQALIQQSNLCPQTKRLLQFQFHPRDGKTPIEQILNIPFNLYASRHIEQTQKALALFHKKHCSDNPIMTVNTQTPET